MEAEFVNEFISRLTSNLHDTISKNVMLETRMAVLEKSTAIIQANYEKAQEDLLKAREELERLKKKTKPSDV
jgi:signal transduction histidine kinase